MSRNYIGLVVAPWKFDVLETSIFVLRTSNFRGATISRLFLDRNTLFFKQIVNGVANQRTAFTIERQQIYTNRQTRQKRGKCFLFLKYYTFFQTYRAQGEGQSYDCQQEPITRSLISHTNPMRQPLRVSFFRLGETLGSLSCIIDFFQSSLAKYFLK